MQTGNGIFSKRGATLIEVIVALGIAVLIVVVVATTHQALTRHASSQAERLKENDKVVNTVREIREDLQNLFVPESDPECGITLQNKGGQLVTLTFCRWNKSTGKYPAYTNRLEQVTYFIGERKRKPALLKSIKQLAGPQALQPAVTNWVEPSWPNLRIELHNGEAWQSSWTADAEEEIAVPAPSGARIQFMPPSGKGETLTPLYETMVIIPAGMSASSSTARASSAGSR